MLFRSTGPSQKDMAKPADYERSLKKLVDSIPAEGGKTDELPAQGGKRVKVARKKRDVPQLGEQSKKTISSLKVAPSRRRAENTLTAQQKYELQIAAEVGMSVGELDPLSNAPLPGTPAVAFKYVRGGPMVPPGVAEDLPTRVVRESRKERANTILFLPWKGSFLRSRPCHSY